MSHERRWAVVLGSVVLAAGCDGRPRDLREWTPEDHGQNPSEENENERGSGAAAAAAPDVRSLWSVHCADCHGANGRGDGIRRPAGTSIPDFANPDWQGTRSNEELALAIARGRGAMPAFGSTLVPEQIAALVFFIRGFGAP